MSQAFLALSTAEQTVVLAVPAALFLLSAVLLALLVRARRGGKAASAPDIPLTGVPRVPRVTVARVHDRGNRDEQQDCMAVSPVEDTAKGVLAVVADGMGGMSRGGEVSMRATGAMFQSFLAEPAGENPRSVLLRSLSRARDEVNGFLGEDGLRRSGSTLVAANLRGGELWWLSVGDSRLFLYRGGALIPLNRRHNYGGELDTLSANGGLDADSALTDPRRGELTSYLGMGMLSLLDGNTEALPLLPGDRVLLTSDGVSEVLSLSELAETQRFPPEESARRVEAAVRAKARPHQDNFTAVILEYA